MSSLNVHFGLGQATAITQVIIRWPSGIIDTINNPTVNQSLVVIEGSTLAIGNFSANEFSLYPNPTKDILNIKFTSDIQIVSAEVFDMLGKRVYETNVTNQIVPVQSLSKGTYIILLRDTDGKPYSQKFIKE
jgi:hypothetical protein